MTQDTNNQEWWEGELFETLRAWVNKSDVNYRLGDDHHGAGWTVDVNELKTQIDPLVRKVSQQSREDALKEVVDGLKKKKWIDTEYLGWPRQESLDALDGDDYSRLTAFDEHNRLIEDLISLVSKLPPKQ